MVVLYNFLLFFASLIFVYIEKKTSKITLQFVLRFTVFLLNFYLVYRFYLYDIHPYYFIVAIAFSMLFLNEKGKFQSIFFLTFVIFVHFLCFNYDFDTQIQKEFYNISINNDDFILKDCAKYLEQFSFIMIVLAFILTSAKKTTKVRFLMYSAAIISLVSSVSWANFIVQYEAAAVVVVLTIWNNKSNPMSYGVGLRYALVHFTSGFIILVALSSIPEGIFSPMIKNAVLQDGIYYYVFMFAILLNVGAFPFSFWIKDSYSNVMIHDTCVLQCYTTKVSLIFLALFFAGNELLIIIGILTLLYSLIAILYSSNMVRILCYAISGHISLFMLLIGSGIIYVTGTDIFDYVFVSLKYQLLSMIAVYLIFLSYDSIYIGRLNYINDNVFFRNIILVLLSISALSIFAFPFTSSYTIKNQLLNELHGNIIYYIFYLGNFFIATFTLVRIICFIVQQNFPQKNIQSPKKFKLLSLINYNKIQTANDYGHNGVMTILFSGFMIASSLLDFNIFYKPDKIILYLYGGIISIILCTISFVLCIFFKRKLLAYRKDNKYDIDYFGIIMILSTLDRIFNIIYDLFRKINYFIFKRLIVKYNVVRHSLTDFVSINILEFTIISFVLCLIISFTVIAFI